MKKRITALIIILVIICSLAPAATALNVTEALNSASMLNALGLFKGVGTKRDGSPNYDLGRTPTRNEAVTMLVRLLGKEEEALAGEWETPFADVAEWAEPYVGYAYNNGLTGGISPTEFGGENNVTAAQYMTFVLRALGYSSETDFAWNNPWELSLKLGLRDEGDYETERANINFSRGGVAVISFRALGVPHKETGEKIIERIYNKTLASEESFTELDDLVDAACAARLAMSKTNPNVSECKKYAPSNPDTRGLLSTEEIKMLSRTNQQKTVTYEQAVADVDLYIRSFKYAYGAYYYFGEKVFDEIKAKAIDDLKSKTTVTAGELSSILKKHMSVIRDAHLSRTDHVDYESYYCAGQYFMREGSRYYKLIDGEKWYYEGCNSNYVKMKPFLTETGALVYTPVWFYYRDRVPASSDITLKNSGKKMTETLQWTATAAITATGLDYKFLKENNIAYISVRNFSSAAGDYNKFLTSAYKVKSSDVIIFDLRGNRGGMDRYSRQWIVNYSGQTPHPRMITATRYSAFFSSVEHGKEYFGNVGYSYGPMIDNDALVIILVDDLCVSAGEFAVKQLLTLDNSVVIGSQTGGCTFCCGTFIRLSLPNSGVSYSMGNTMFWLDDSENGDDIGIEPDIWCDPGTSLESVLMMLIRNGYTDVDTAWKMTRGLN